MSDEIDPWSSTWFDAVQSSTDDSDSRPDRPGLNEEWEQIPVSREKSRILLLLLLLPNSAVNVSTGKLGLTRLHDSPNHTVMG